MQVEYQIQTEKIIRVKPINSVSLSAFVQYNVYYARVDFVVSCVELQGRKADCGKANKPMHTGIGI